MIIKGYATSCAGLFLYWKQR